MRYSLTWRPFYLTAIILEADERPREIVGRPSVRPESIALLPLPLGHETHLCPFRNPTVIFHALFAEDYYSVY